MFNPAISFHVFSLKPSIGMEAVDCSSSESETDCDSSSSYLPPIETTHATALPATTSAALRPPRMDDSEDTIEPLEGVAIFRKISDSSNVDDTENTFFYFNFNPPKK